MDLISLISELFEEIKRKNDQNAFDVETSAAVDELVDFEKKLGNEFDRKIATEKTKKLHAEVAAALCAKLQSNKDTINGIISSILTEENINKFDQDKLTGRDVYNSLSLSQVVKVIFIAVTLIPTFFKIAWNRSEFFSQEKAKWTIKNSFISELIGAKPFGEFAAQFMALKDEKGKFKFPQTLFYVTNPKFTMPHGVGFDNLADFNKLTILIPWARLLALKNFIPKLKAADDVKKLEALLTDSGKYELIRLYLSSPKEKQDNFDFKMLAGEKGFILDNLYIFQGVFAKEYEILKQKQSELPIPEIKIEEAVKNFHHLFIEGKFSFDKMRNKRLDYAIEVIKNADREEFKKHPTLFSNLLRFVIHSIPELQNLLAEKGFTNDDPALKLADMLAKSPESIVDFTAAYLEFRKSSRDQLGNVKDPDPKVVQLLLVCGVKLLAEISANGGFSELSNKSAIEKILTRMLTEEFTKGQKLDEQQLASIKRKVSSLVELVAIDLENPKNLEELAKGLGTFELNELVKANDNYSKDKKNPEKIGLVGAAALKLLQTEPMQIFLLEKNNREKIQNIIFTFISETLIKSKLEKVAELDKEQLDSIIKKVNSIVELIAQDLVHNKSLEDLTHALTTPEFRELILANESLSTDVNNPEKIGLLAAAALRFLKTEAMQEFLLEENNRKKIKEILAIFIADELIQSKLEKISDVELQSVMKKVNYAVDMVSQDLENPTNLEDLASATVTKEFIALLNANDRLAKDKRNPESIGALIAAGLNFLKTDAMQKFLREENNREKIKEILSDFMTDELVRNKLNDLNLHKNSEEVEIHDLEDNQLASVQKKVAAIIDLVTQDLESPENLGHLASAFQTKEFKALIQANETSAENKNNVQAQSQLMVAGINFIKTTAMQNFLKEPNNRLRIKEIMSAFISDELVRGKLDELNKEQVLSQQRIGKLGGQELENVMKNAGSLVDLLIHDLESAENLAILSKALITPEFNEIMLANNRLSKDKNNPKNQSQLVAAGLNFLKTPPMQEFIKEEKNRERVQNILSNFITDALIKNAEGQPPKKLGDEQLGAIKKNVAMLVELVVMNLESPANLDTLAKATASSEFLAVILANNTIATDKKDPEKLGALGAAGLNFLRTRAMQEFLKEENNRGKIKNILTDFIADILAKAELDERKTLDDSQMAKVMKKVSSITGFICQDLEHPKNLDALAKGCATEEFYSLIRIYDTFAIDKKSPKNLGLLVSASLQLIKTRPMQVFLKEENNRDKIRIILSEFITDELVKMKLAQLNNDELDGTELENINRKVAMIVTFISQDLENTKDLETLANAFLAEEFHAAMHAYAAYSVDKKNSQKLGQLASAVLGFLRNESMQAFFQEKGNREKIHEILSAFITDELVKSKLEDLNKGKEAGEQRISYLDDDKMFDVAQKVKLIVELISQDLENPKDLEDLAKAFLTEEFQTLVNANEELSKDKENPTKLANLALAGLGFLTTSNMQDVLQNVQNQNKIKEILDVFFGKAIPANIRVETFDLVMTNCLNPNNLSSLSKVIASDKGLNSIRLFTTLSKAPSPEEQKELVISLLNVMTDVNMQSFIANNKDDVEEVLTKFLKGKFPEGLEGPMTDLIIKNILEPELLNSLNSALANNFIPIANDYEKYRELNTRRLNLEKVDAKNVDKARYLLVVKCLYFLNTPDMRKILSTNEDQLKHFITKAITSLKGANEQDVGRSVQYVMSVYNNEALFTQVIGAVEKNVNGVPLSYMEMGKLAYNAFDTGGLYALYNVFKSEQKFSERVAAAVYNVSNEEARKVLVSTIDIIIESEQANKLSKDPRFEAILVEFIEAKVAKNSSISTAEVQHVFTDFDKHIKDVTEKIMELNGTSNHTAIYKEISEGLLKDKWLTEQILNENDDVFTDLLNTQGARIANLFKPKSVMAGVTSFFSKTMMGSKSTETNIKKETLNDIISEHYQKVNAARGQGVVIGAV